MNPNSQNHKSQAQNLTIIWLVYLMTTVSLPLISFISNQSQPEIDTLNVSDDLTKYIFIGMGLALFLASYFIFKSISGRPMAYEKYVTPFIISLTVAEASTLFGFVYATMFHFDVFTYSLFALGFLAVLLKRPYTNLIASPLQK